MTRAETKRKADALRGMHAAGDLLIVPNAFDAASARILEAAGFPTVATSSAAMAWTAGFRDGQELSFEAALELHTRAARAVAIPVSVDFEGGYVTGSGDIATTIEALIDAGVAGVGLEDTNFSDGEAPLHDAAAHAKVIGGARETADRLGVPLFINGRTDIFFREVGAPEQRADEAVRRLTAYAAAGADCVFAPGIADRADIAAVVGQVDVPLNVMYTPATPDVGELRELGVGRLTFGAHLYMAALAAVENVAGQLKNDQIDQLATATTLSRESLRALFR